MRSITITRLATAIRAEINQAGTIFFGHAQKLGGRGMILVYHRVAELKRDSQKLAVRPEHFKQHMKILQINWNVISLAELVVCIQRRRIPDRSIAITLDDGYADNLYNAAPILDAYGFPATVFVSTKIISECQTPFWDELDEIFLGDHLLPQRLMVNLGSVDIDLLTRSLAEREGAYSSICVILTSLSSSLRKRVMERIRDWASINGPQTTSFLSVQELKRLAGYHSIQIGGHTQSHILLPSQPEEEQRREIEGCRDDLFEWLGVLPTAFCYPWGLTFLPQAKVVRQMVRDAGFLCATDTIRGSVGWIGTDVYRLPRAKVQDCPGEHFHGWLEKTFASPWLNSQ